MDYRGHDTNAFFTANFIPRERLRIYAEFTFTYREGLPKVLLEAASCGRPIVTTDTPGCRDVVRQGENGLLVPVRGTAELADALQLLIEQPELRKKMGCKGREIVVSEFALEKVVAKTMNIYRELLKP